MNEGVYVCGFDAFRLDVQVNVSEVDHAGRPTVIAGLGWASSFGFGILCFCYLYFLFLCHVLLYLYKVRL